MREGASGRFVPPGTGWATPRPAVFGLGGTGNGDGDNGALLLWRLTVAEHGGGTTGTRNATETGYVAGGCVRGGKPLSSTSFFHLLWTLFLFTLLSDMPGRRLLKISLAHF